MNFDEYRIEFIRRKHTDPSERNFADAKSPLSSRGEKTTDVCYDVFYNGLKLEQEGNSLKEAILIGWNHLVKNHGYPPHALFKNKCFTNYVRQYDPPVYFKVKKIK